MDDEAWREFWSGDGDHSAALGGAHALALALHWRGFFSGLTGDSAPLVVDIAAGTGAALREGCATLAGAGRKPCLAIALDISEDAVRSALRSIPGAYGAVCSGAALPFSDRSVDIAVSQFGIEYAGRAAFPEAARVLSPEGAFCAISHYRGGGIETECAANARLLGEVMNSGLFETAKAAFEVSFDRRRNKAAPDADHATERAFRAAFTAASAATGSAPDYAGRRSLERFLADLARLSSRRLAYEDRDAIGWIDAMQASLDAYRRRMASMCAAALGESDIREINAIFNAAGCAGFSASPLSLTSGAAPAAWIIRAGAARSS